MEKVDFYKPEAKDEEWARKIYGQNYDASTGRYTGLIELPRKYGRDYTGARFLGFKREGGWTMEGGVIECLRAPLPQEKMIFHSIPSLGIHALPRNPKELYLVKGEGLFVHLYLVPYWNNHEIGIKDGASGEVSLGRHFLPLEERLGHHEAYAELQELKRRIGKPEQRSAEEQAEYDRLFERAYPLEVLGEPERYQRMERAYVRLQEIIDAGNYLIHFFPDDSIHFEECASQSDFELLGQAGLG